MLLKPWMAITLGSIVVHTPRGGGDHGPQHRATPPDWEGIRDFAFEWIMNGFTLIGFLVVVLILGLLFGNLLAKILPPQSPPTPPAPKPTLEKEDGWITR
ncbi:MAG: hypothetical protein JSU72_15770 [Deltaproteobacteria bacterium]|nr:MAG: hypothetical protein JSU72_15770 [Deltaproteobacteria bacterium]